MNSSMHGNSTSTVEVTNISAHGIWMLCRDEELFLSFQDFPWFAGRGKSMLLTGGGGGEEWAFAKRNA